MRFKLISVGLIASLVIAAGVCNVVADSAAPAPASPARDPGFHVDMNQVITYLASDELEGRMVGTPGLAQAANFIADDFAKLGLKTLPGLNGYFQPFDMTTSVLPDTQNTWLVADGHTFHPGKDMVPLRFSAEASVEAPLAFVGYGETNPQDDYDDYADVDVKGKVVLVMRFEPFDRATGKSRFATADRDYSGHATLHDKLEDAVNHGAAGILFVNPPLHHGSEGLMPFLRSEMISSKVPVAQVTQEVADELLKAGGAPDLTALQNRIDESGKPAHVELKNVKVKLAVAFKATRKRVENVVGLLPGAGPHADEYIVISAHYDHLGHGGPNSLAPWSHAIHHGADDNASGTAAMMELADRFAHQSPPARSLIFIACTGEEEGLLGSEYFVNHPPVPLEKIVADLNLDMVGRVKNDKLLIGGMGTATVFPQMLAKADDGLGLDLGEFGKGGIGPSDHMSFAMKKIPVLFFYDNMLIDYHRPTDTADKINFEGLNKVVELGQRVLTSMTTMPRQQYVSTYDATGLKAMGMGHGSRASLGVVPDYSEGTDGAGGVRISGTVPGSAAEKTGLKAGDIITHFADKKIDNLIDLTNALAAAKPGQKVKIEVKRDGKPVEIEATLTERK